MGTHRRIAGFVVLGLLVGGLSAVAPSSATAASAPVSTQIDISDALGEPNRFGDNVPAEAIDGNVSTGTYTTPGSTVSFPSYLEFGFASATDTAVPVNRLRIHKDAEYGPHDLTIQYSTGAGQLPSRTWTTVTGLTNGFGGDELLTATAVNTNGTVDNDSHVSPGGGGVASLMFDTVEATGLRIGFSGSSPCCNHYHVFEFEAYHVDFPPTVDIALDPASPDGTNGFYVSDVHATVSAPDADVAEVRCVLDPEEEPVTFADIPASCAFDDTGADVTTDGEHTLYAATADTAGLDSDVASSTFTIDQTDPVATIDEGVGGSTNDTTPTWAFSSGEGSSTFQCSIDTGTESFASCTSPHDAPALDEDDYTFRVRAIDQAGNIGPADTEAFVVDTTGPIVTIDSGPADGGATNDATPTFVFSSPEENVFFRCSVQQGAANLGDCPNQASHTPATLADGTWTFTVEGEDATGNKTAVQRTFTVDTVGPTVAITDPDANGTTQDADVTFTFSSSDGTVACAMDAGSFGACTSAMSHAVTGLSDGQHTFRVRGTDQAANQTIAERQFTVDTIGPVITFTAKPKKKTTKRTGNFQFSSSEGGTFTCQLDTAAAAPCDSGALIPTGKLKPGRHTFTVLATDTHGNGPTTTAYSWKILRR